MTGDDKQIYNAIQASILYFINILSIDIMADVQTNLFPKEPRRVLGVRIPESAHQKLRLLAALEGKSMAVTVTDLINKAYENEERKGRIRVDDKKP